MHSFLRRVSIASVLSVLSIPCVLGQAAGVPIESQQPLSNDPQLLAQAAQLREAGALLTQKAVAEQLAKPSGGSIALAETASRPLSGRELAARGRDAHVRLGWYYLCKRCDKWHVDTAGAYAIAPDALATCYHCLEGKAEMKEGYLIAIDAKDKVHAIRSVLACSRTMDCAIVRVMDGSFTPLALQEDVAPGDKVACFSDPLGQVGYFSTGVVNRFYWNRGKRGAAGSLDELKSLRVNVSTDWAPGSSGAAVLDECGNVIAHVSRISSLSPKTGEQTPPAKKEVATQGDRARGGKGTTPAPKVEPVLITLHEAVPARSVRALAMKAAETAGIQQAKEAKAAEPAPAVGEATPGK